MKDLLSMKQFSLLSGIEISTLRYWDLIGLFAPALRNEENNYRYYKPVQVMTARFISVMSKLGVPLKTIKEMEVDRSPEKVAAVIALQVHELDDEMRKLRDNYSIIHTRLNLINYGIKANDGFNSADGIDRECGEPNEAGEIVTDNTISVLYRNAFCYISGPENRFKEGEDFYEPFMHFCRQADELRINLGFPIVGYHENLDSFLKIPGQPDTFVSLDPSGNKVREAGNYLIGYCRNYYGRFGDLPERMADYAAKHKLKTVGPVFSMYLQDELCVKDPDQYLVEVSVKIKD